jgi:hypothetical protein
LYLDVVPNGLPFLPPSPNWHELSELNESLSSVQIAVLDLVDVCVSMMKRFNANDEGVWAVPRLSPAPAAPAALHRPHRVRTRTPDAPGPRRKTSSALPTTPCSRLLAALADSLDLAPSDATDDAPASRRRLSPR